MPAPIENYIYYKPIENEAESNNDEWLAFNAGFRAARELYNSKLSGKRKWILLADKWIANAFWRYKRQ